CFFFQAEDGIRDPLVTGVQTCALPILVDPLALVEVHRLARRLAEQYGHRLQRGGAGVEAVEAAQHQPVGREAVQPEGAAAVRARSEERRVGKGGGEGWAAEQCKERREE